MENNNVESFLGMNEQQKNEIKNVSNTPVSEYDKLQEAANYRFIRKNLRPGGIGSIIFGIIAIIMGINGMDDNSINVILALIGFLLTIEGAWLILSPTPAGMMVDGFALIVLGAWNLIITIMNASNGGGTTSFAIVGVFQIIWGFQSFGRYSKFSKLPQAKPSDETMQKLDQIATEIKKLKMTNNTDIIEFQGKGYTAQQLWKGRLKDTNAIFVDSSGQDLIFAKKENILFTNEGKALIGKSMKTSIKIGDRVLAGSITQEAFDRYEKWKLLTN